MPKGARKRLLTDRPGSCRLPSVRRGTAVPADLAEPAESAARRRWHPALDSDAWYVLGRHAERLAGQTAQLTEKHLCIEEVVRVRPAERFQRIDGHKHDFGSVDLPQCLFFP